MQSPQPRLRRPGVPGSSRAILKGLVVVAWLTAALALGRLADQYISAGKKGPQLPKQGSLLKPSKGNVVAQSARAPAFEAVSMDALPAAAPTGSIALLGAVAMAASAMVVAGGMMSLLPTVSRELASSEAGGGAALAQAQGAALGALEQGVHGLQDTWSQLSGPMASVASATGEAMAAASAECHKVQEAVLVGMAKGQSSLAAQADLVPQAAGPIIAKGKAVLGEVDPKAGALCAAFTAVAVNAPAPQPSRRVPLSVQSRQRLRPCVAGKPGLVQLTEPAVTFRGPIRPARPSRPTISEREQAEAQSRDLRAVLLSAQPRNMA